MKAVASELILTRLEWAAFIAAENNAQPLEERADKLEEEAKRLRAQAGQLRRSTACALCEDRGIDYRAVSELRPISDERRAMRIVVQVPDKPATETPPELAEAFAQAFAHD